MKELEKPINENQFHSTHKRKEFYRKNKLYHKTIRRNLNKPISVTDSVTFKPVSEIESKKLNDTELNKICNLLSIEKIPEERNYWLIRTESGKYYFDFLQNSYVAIGWDEFSDINAFKNIAEDNLKEQITNTYKDEKKPGYIYNQIKRFMSEIKNGDMILIPSENSHQIAFGIVTKTFYVRNVPDTPYSPQNPKCTFKKCISVKWKNKIYKDTLSADLRMLLFTHTTISNINEYKDFINRTLYPIYLLDNNIHIIFNVKSKKAIDVLNLSNFLMATYKISDEFANYLNIPIPNKNLNVKLNVQSPGPIEFFGNIFDFANNNAGAILLLALSLHFIVGGSFQCEKTEEKSSFSSNTEGILDKLIKLIQESHKHYNEKAQLKMQKEGQKFNQLMEIFKISNPLLVESKSQSSIEENKKDVQQTTSDEHQDN